MQSNEITDKRLQEMIAEQNRWLAEAEASKVEARAGNEITDNEQERIQKRAAPLTRDQYLRVEDILTTLGLEDGNDQTTISRAR